MSDSEDSNDSFFMNGKENRSEDVTLLESESSSEDNQSDNSINLESDDLDDSSEEEQESDNDDKNTKEKGKTTKKVLGETKPLSDEAIAEFNAKIKRTGVVYLSSIPPFMSYQKIIYLLGEYGKINRSYIVGNEASQRYHRKHPGSHKREKFTEGWVEFENKRDAKTCVSQLNGRIVGGKKQSAYHDYIWTMKYLKNFKWPQLEEMLSYEKRLRYDKLKAEFAHSHKEDEKYLEKVTESMKHKKAEEKRKEKEKEKEKRKSE